MRYCLGIIVVNLFTFMNFDFVIPEELYTHAFIVVLPCSATFLISLMFVCMHVCYLFVIEVLTGSTPAICSPFVHFAFLSR